MHRYPLASSIAMTALLFMLASTARAQHVFVYDNPVDVSGELTGQTDFDPPEKINLTIAWNAPVENAVDWHVYVRQNDGGARYLGRAGSGSLNRLHWFANSTNIHRDFLSGPQPGAAYAFRVIRIDDSFGPDDIFDQSGLTGFAIEGGGAIDLSPPTIIQPPKYTLAIYDDIDAQTNASNADEDDPRRREIMLAWNLDNQAPIVNVHIWISANQTPFAYLGQTHSGGLNYFRWNDAANFLVHPNFQAGPQDGNRYRFRIVAFTTGGGKIALGGGAVAFSVIDRTSTPTPTPTATSTPMATSTPTPTPTPVAGLNVETMTVPLPALPPGAKPLTMVRIQPGAFMQGSPAQEQDREPNEGPSHWVSLARDYHIGQFEITQAQYQAVMGRNPALFPDPNRPVFLITWHDAARFCNALSAQQGRDLVYDESDGSMNLAADGFRLPTESEWEYAARAGTATRYYWGDDPNHVLIGEHAWHSGNAGSGGSGVDLPLPAGLKKPNAFGLFDMSGNVWEWCADAFADYGDAPVADPWIASGTERVIRGGSWFSGVKFQRSAARQSVSPEFKSGTVGMRVVVQ